jgi:DNA (cytosine-5)-methyltransferase 1
MHGTGWLLLATQKALRELGKPYVVENVAGAHMPATVTLCGSMFGLRTCRHRKFEVGGLFTLWSLPAHPKHRVRTSTKKRRTCWDAGLNISVTGDIGSTIGGLALDIDWMNGNELSQAIPPAYTEFIGRQLIDCLQAAA